MSALRETMLLLEVQGRDGYDLVLVPELPSGSAVVQEVRSGIHIRPFQSPMQEDR